MIWGRQAGPGHPVRASGKLLPSTELSGYEEARKVTACLQQADCETVHTYVCGCDLSTHEW